ncbi:hypothetical protein BBP40_000268 [Aspergillus hancockii]|nr:hypothetical protein BBP40_000268 [Aspergillus hancockii]
MESTGNSRKSPGTIVNPLMKKDFCLGANIADIAPLTGVGKLGALVEVKVYLGYTGKRNVNNDGVELSMSKRIATMSEWVETEGQREWDIAFIKLNKPFKKPLPFHTQIHLKKEFKNI